MTFFETFNNIKNSKYDNEIVIFELIYFLSKKVKNKVDFLTYKNDQIDFDLYELKVLLKEYFIKKKPLAHILGETNFCGLRIKVLPNILAPRNDTEFVCQKIKDKIFDIFKNESFDVVDLCCGTGNIGLFIKNEFSESKLTSIDLNPIAVRNTLINANLNKILCSIYTGDYLEFLLKNNLAFDVILMNPPYVSKKELDKKMLRYESKISFINSPEPNDFYFNVINNIEKLVKNKNKFLLGFEISYSRRVELERFLSNKNLNYDFIKDLSNNDRVLIVWKNN